MGALGGVGGGSLGTSGYSGPHSSITSASTTISPTSTVAVLWAPYCCCCLVTASCLSGGSVTRHLTPLVVILGGRATIHALWTALTLPLLVVVVRVLLRQVVAQVVFVADLSYSTTPTLSHT